MREYYSGYFLRKVTLNFNLKKKILTKDQHSKYILFLLVTLSLVIGENEPVVIRCKFPVISYLFSVLGWGTDTLSVEPKKKKKFVIDKEKARSILHVPIDLLERSMQREVFGNKITIVRGYPLDFSVFLLLLGLKQLKSCFCSRRTLSRTVYLGDPQVV